MSVVEVVWLDSGAHVDLGWDSAEHHMQHGLSREVRTVGILMAETEDTVAVALTYDPSSDNWYAAQLVYKPTIVSMRSLA